MTASLIAGIQKAQKLIIAGKLAKAEPVCRKILQKIPDQPEALHLLGLISLRRGQYDHTAQCYEKALKIQPNNSAYHYNLGLAYIHTEQYKLAVDCLKRATELEPGLEGVYSDWCLALIRLGNFEAAIEAGKRAVSQTPNNGNAHFHLALAYHGWRNFENSFKHQLIACQLSPEHPTLLYELANTYIGRNELEEGRQCLLRVLKLVPEHILALTSLARITKYDSVDHEDAQQFRALDSQEHLSDECRIPVLFSLAKIHQDCGLYDKAFAYFERGNNLQTKKYPFSEIEFTEYVSSLIEFQTQKLLAEKRPLGNSSELPVIIVGTPRSGTTLVEQILSSHHNVFGAGELTWFGTAASALSQHMESSTTYPECTQALTGAQIEELAGKYLKYLRSLSGTQQRIVDKLPGNFLNLGLIHLLFPNARIIHCIRQPRDACVSMFCQHFPAGHMVSHDMFKLGVYYQQYQRLMAHWRSALPTGTILELNYEDLVRNQEAVSRRLVEFIGMEWNDACLEFYNKKRRVFTASSMQVTRPMYLSSIDRWKHYEKHLQPLVDGFNYCPDNNLDTCI